MGNNGRRGKFASQNHPGGHYYSQKLPFNDVVMTSALTSGLKPVKIVVIITYFGKLPKFIDYFLLTCAYNKNIDFVLFADDDRVSEFYASDNIKFIYSNTELFNTLAAEKLGVPVAIKDGYKLCDFKPMYGKIYEDYIGSYEFWGFCDIDLVLGDTAKVLSESYLQTVDVVSAHSRYMSGPFSLFRNIPEVNMLFRKSKDFEEIVANQRHLSFDEASSAIQKLWSGGNIFDYPTEVESMTHIVKNPDKCNVRVDFRGCIVERVGTRLTWKEGILTDENGKEVALFHYIIYKGLLLFNVPDFRQVNKLYFEKNGYFLPSIKSRTVDWAESIIKNFYARARFKTKRMLAK